jgi:MbtH protein
MAAPEAVTTYKVVVNDEEQYSIWDAARENPPGWRDAGKSGDKRECLDYIAAVWLDMRPLSLRRAANEAAVEPPAPPPPPADTLLDRLRSGRHAVELVSRDALESGYVHLRFPDVAGGLELGLRLDPAACDYTHADLAAQAGTIQLAGALILNGGTLRCTARIDLVLLTGQCQLNSM